MLSTKRTNQTRLGLEQAPLKEQKAAAGEMPQAPVWHRAPAAVQGSTQHPEGRTPTQENGERRDGHVPGRDVHAVDLEKVATQLHVKPRSKATRPHQNGQKQRIERAGVCGCDTDGLVRAGRRGVSQKPNVRTVLRRVCTLDSSHRTTSRQADETCWPLHSSGTAAHAASLSAAPAQPTLVPLALGGARPVCWVWGRPAMNTAQPPGAS